MTGTLFRTEKKAIFPLSALSAFLSDLSAYMQPDPYCLNNAQYTVVSHYFDTDGDDLIRRSNQKPRYKEKFRLRSYGFPASAADEVFLEIKRKADGIVYKRRAVAALDDAQRFLTDRIVPPRQDDPLSRQIFTELGDFLDRRPLHPAYLVSYTRTAWFGKNDPTLRLTIDQSLTAWRSPVLFEKTGAPRPLNAPGEGVLEVKINRAVPLWMAKLFADYGIVFGSFSKVGQAHTARLLSGGAQGWTLTTRLCAAQLAAQRQAANQLTVIRQA